jgi:hypothetical protein
MIGHDVLTSVAARSLGLAGPPVAVTPYRYERIDTGPYNPDHVVEMREGARATVYSPWKGSDEPAPGYYDESDYEGDFLLYDPPEGGLVDPLQVLSIYSAEPDWGMDAGMDLSPLQALTGGSQGFRHLRFGLFLLRVGRVRERAVHFTRLARCAFDEDDPYWGLRFSARALHYLQDAVSPFHLKPFPEPCAPLMALMPRRFYRRTVNYHLNFERLVGYRLWHGDAELIGTIERAAPAPLDDVGDLARAMRASRRQFYPIYRRCRILWGRTMDGEYVKVSTDRIREASEDAGMNDLIRRWLAHAASWVKGYLVRYTARAFGGEAR